MYTDKGPVRHVGMFFVLYDNEEIYFINREKVQGFAIERKENKGLLTGLRNTLKKPKVI